MVGKGVRSIAVNASYLFASHGVTNLVRGIYAILLARALGPEVYGIFNYGLSWYLVFLPLSALGIGFILSREIGRKAPGYEKVVGQTLVFRNVAAIVIAIVCGLTGWLIESDQVIRQLIIVFSFALFGRALALWTNSVFVAFEESRYAFRQDSTFRVIEVISGAIILYVGGGILEIAILHALVWWLQGIRGVTLIRKHLMVVKANWDIKALLKLLKEGMPFALLALSVSWMNQGPIIMYKHIMGVESHLGQLALVMQALFLVGGIPFSLSQAVLPVLHRTIERKDGKDTVYVEGMLRIGFILGAVAGLSGIALGPWFVPLIFGERYTYTGDLLGPALWLLVPMIWASAMGQVIMVRGLYRYAVICSIIAVVTLFLILPPLVKTYDAYGAIAALGIAYFVLSIGQKLVLHRTDPVKFDQTFLRPALSVILSLGTYIALTSMHFVLALAASLSVLLISVYFIGVIDKSEKDHLITLLRNTLNRYKSSR